MAEGAVATGVVKHRLKPLAGGGELLSGMRLQV